MMFLGIIYMTPFSHLSSLSPLQASPFGACARGRARSSALADRPRLCRRWHPGPSCDRASWARLVDESFVGQALPGNSVNEAVEPLHRMTLYVALIQAERELVNVAAKVFLAGVMIDTDQSALHDREHAFHAVRGHVIADIFAIAMVDGFVIEEQSAKAAVNASLIGVQRSASGDVLVNFGVQGRHVGVIYSHRLHAALALTHRDNGGLTDRAATGFKLLGLVLVLLDSADVGFVNLDDALELFEIAAAGFPQAMQNKPRRLLRDADLLRQLQAGYALAGRHKQIHRVNPLVQRNVAALENRAGADGEIFLALVAAVEPARPRRDPLTKTTYRATRPLRPKPPFQIGSRGLLVREHGEQLECRNRRFGHELDPLTARIHPPKLRDMLFQFRYARLGKIIVVGIEQHRHEAVKPASRLHLKFVVQVFGIDVLHGSGLPSELVIGRNRRVVVADGQERVLDLVKGGQTDAANDAAFLEQPVSELFPAGVAVALKAANETPAIGQNIEGLLSAGRKLGEVCGGHWLNSVLDEANVDDSRARVKGVMYIIPMFFIPALGDDGLQQAGSR